MSTNLFPLETNLKVPLIILIKMKSYLINSLPGKLKWKYAYDIILYNGLRVRLTFSHD